MLIHKKLTSKNGKEYYAIFWLFESGKTYRLGVSPFIARLFVQNNISVEGN